MLLSLSSQSMRPTLPELLRLNLHMHVQINNIEVLGYILLQDDTGSVVGAIRHQCHRKEDMVIKILQEWVVGKGKAVSWQCLVETLRDLDQPSLNYLVDEIDDKIKGIGH